MNLVFIELILTSILTGLIWTIQLINYPQLSLVKAQDYSAFHLSHIRAITPLVAPLMVMEVLFWGMNLYQKNVSFLVSLCSFVLLAFVWGTTFFVSVPLHNQMVAAKNIDLIKKLVLTNWIRTIAWTVKLFVLGKLFIRV